MGERLQLRPWSAVSSMRQRQPSSSVLEGQTSVPSASSTGLAPDGPIDAARQALRRRPALPLVGRAHEHAPPELGARAHLVEEEERAAAGPEQHGIPAGQLPAARPLAAGDEARLAPAVLIPVREPDAHIGGPFARAAEPGADEPAGCRLDDRRGVRRWKGCGLEDEAPAQPGGAGKGQTSHAAVSGSTFAQAGKNMAAMRSRARPCGHEPRASALPRQKMWRHCHAQPSLRPVARRRRCRGHRLRLQRCRRGQGDHHQVQPRRVRPTRPRARAP